LEKRKVKKKYASHVEEAGLSRYADEQSEVSVRVSAGIAGILQHEKNERESVENLQKDALSDLSNLVIHAEDVLKVLEKYKAVLEREGGSADTASERGEMSEIEEILYNIGMV
jgi:hypothetical protein